MTSFALYDLDGTVLHRATFTPFLLFAARCRAPWRVALAPVWIAAMAGYKAGLFSRGALKQFGLDLFLGPKVRESDLAALGEAFAERVVPAWVAPGAARSIVADRAAGRRLVLVTAAMRFYAEPIARRLGFDRVLATGHRAIADAGRCRLDGENCYGAEKVERVAAMLAQGGLAREACHLVFYSDSVSDAPLFDYADEAVLVDTGSRALRFARHRGWRTESFAAFKPRLGAS